MSGCGLTFHIQPSPFEVIQQAGANPSHLLMPRNRFALHKLYWRTTAVVDSKSFKWQGFETTPLLQYSKLFKWQGFQNNSSTAVFKVIQVAGVPKQLLYCSIQSYSSCRGSKTTPLLQNQSHSSGRGSKTTPLLQYSKWFERQGYRSNSATAIFLVIELAGVPEIIPPLQNSKTKLFLFFYGKLAPWEYLKIREMK